jgi:CDP-diglyceride synthetase
MYTHTHTVEMGFQVLFLDNTMAKGRERKTGVFIFGIYQGAVLLLVCVCVICIFFRKGGTIESLRLFSLPSRRALFYMISFSFLSFSFSLSSNPIRTRFVRAFWFFFSTFVLQTLFYLLAPRNKKEIPLAVLNLFFLFFLPNIFSHSPCGVICASWISNLERFSSFGEKNIFFLYRVVQLNDTESQSSAMTLWFYSPFFFVSLSF